MSSLISINSFDRLYFCEIADGDEVKKALFQNGEEQKGAGVRCYCAPIGWLLNKMGYSSKIEVGDKSFYINNKSLFKFVVRCKEMETIDITSTEEAAKKINDLYISHKKDGYDEGKLEELKNDYKLSTEETKSSKKDGINSGMKTQSFGEIMVRLLEVARK